MIGGPTTFTVVLKWLTEHRVAMGALVMATAVLAVISVLQMPLQLLPEIRYPQVRIIGDLPGQTSRVIEESINEPMEAALVGTPGVVQMESRSGDGRAYIDLFFEADYDLDRGLRDVTQAAQRAQAQIPAEFPEPRIFAVSTMEEPVIQYAFGSSTLSAPEIRQRLRANLLPRLRSVEGVEAVYVGREEISELVIDIDPHLQTSMGVELGAIEEMLLDATNPPPSSAMRTSHFEGIGVLGEDGWDVQRLQLRPLFVDGPDRSVPLASIASAHRAPSQESLRTRLNGESAVLVTIHRAPGAHALQMADEVHRILEEASSTSAFEEIEGTLLYDDSRVTRNAVRSVVVAAVGGALLAMVLLFFALRRRRYVPLVALVVGVSLSAALVVLFLMGMSLNLLTLAGLLLSVGLGLDYAIIYLDRLDRVRRKKGEPDEAHLKAMADVVGPLLGALLTTLAAVLPFMLVEGLVALLFRPLIWTVVICAIFSFVFAVILLPTFARAADEEDDDEVGAPAPWLGRLIRPSLGWPVAVLLGAVMLWGAQTLPFEVLPVVDDGFVDVRVTHPVGIPIEEMDRLTRDVERQLQSVEGTEALFATVGGYFREGLPSFRPGTANFMIRVDTDGGARPSAQWADDARRAVEELEVPDLSLRITPPRIRGVQTQLSDADLIVVLTMEDGDLLSLSEVETQILELLGGVEGLIDVERMRGGVSPRWLARPDYQALADLGVEPSDLARVVDYGLEGKILRERMEGGEPLALRVRYQRRFAGGPETLEGLRLPSSSGGYVHLGGVVDFELIEEPTHIERREGQRVVRVAGQLDPGGPGPAVVAENVERALAEADLADGVSWWLEGEVDALEETRRTFTMALFLALMMVLTILLVQYGSLSFALAGLLTIPLSGAGAFALLGILGRPLDAMVLAGLLIAVGIVANNVILVLSEAKKRAGAKDVTLEEALQLAAQERLRPITLTVLSTAIGMSPLLLGGSEAFGLLQPLAIAVTGALLVSIPVACILLPVVAKSFSLGRDR